VTNVELLGAGLAIVGVVFAVYYGQKALKSRRSQRQRVRKGGVGIQSGRDTTIGRQ